MKPHFIALALIACGVGLSARAVRPPPPAQTAATQIDFAALQQQADAALDHLRHQRQQHMPARAIF